MREYQGFAISNFRTGFDESVEPWLLPRDAYQSMTNAHLYRGVLEKIEGYRLFAEFGNRNFLSLGTPNGSTKNYTGVLPSLPISSASDPTLFWVYGTITAGSAAETFSYTSDLSSTVIKLTGTNGGTGTVNIATGAYNITFGVAPPAGLYSAIFITWDSAPTTKTAIMGIKQYFNQNGSQEIIVFDQKRVGNIVSNMGVLGSAPRAIQSISEIPHDYLQSAVFTGNGSTTSFTGTLATGNFVPGTVVFTQNTPAGAVVRTITDNGVGGLTGTGVSSGFINYVSGAYTITFSAAPTNGNIFNATVGIYGDLFTGSISDFFSLVNYQSKAFFTNNVDRIMYYDGTSLHYLDTNLTQKILTATGGVPNNLDITRCLHVFVNRERLLLISPVISQVPAVSTIVWSVAGDPLDFSNGELLQAPTSEPIRAIGFINSDLVVRFASSERVFRYTADAFSPFRWDSTNNIWACDAPHSSINYDSWFSSVGRPAIVGSDAVNVKRVDEIIPDFTDPTRLALQTPVPFMNQTSIIQCYGERFDDIKEGWLCYNSAPVDQGSITASDNVLSFNYLDATYAVYSFPFSCLGFGRIVNVPTWASTFTTWDDMSETWDSYQLQSNSLIDLGGDQFDRVYELNSANTQTVAGDPTCTPTPVLMSVITKNLNPYVEAGQLAILGYVDLLVTANQQSTLRVQFYVNDQLYIDSNDEPAGYYKEVTLQFAPKDAMSPNTNQTKVWKRIYVGAVGKVHTIRFYQNLADFAETDNQPIYIHAMVPYFKPAGILFN